MKKLRIPGWSLPLVFLGVCTLAFGLLVPWLGFYQDDWYQVWFRRAFGAGVFPEYYAGERPFIAGIYMLTMPIIGNFPLGWQIFALLSRWVSVLAVFWTLRLVWPRYTRQVVWITLLFAVFPGFREQFASVIYSHYFLQLAVQMASIGLMVLAVRRPRHFWVYTILSLLTQFLGIFTSEYFFGLELLRPIFLWMVLSEDSGRPRRERVRRFMLSWMPYLSVTLLFLLWRIFIFKFPTYQPVIYQNEGTGFLGLSARLAQTVLQDLLDMGLLAWVKTLNILPAVLTGLPAAVIAVILFAVSGLALFYYLSRVQLPEHPDPENSGTHPSIAVRLIWIGGLGLLVSGLPFWFVGLPVDSDIESGSRFAISFMLASSFLVAGLVDLFLRRSWIKNLAVACLVGLCIGYHFTDANFYRQVHRNQATLFQQLAWRAPGLKPGTLVLTNTSTEPMLSGDNSLTAALNWIYEGTPPYSLDYMLFYIPSRLTSGNLPGLIPDLPVIKEFRTTEFVGSTSHALVVYSDYPHCLRVLDPQVDKDLPRPLDMPREMRDAVGISNLEQIITDPAVTATLPESLFKYRPAENTWCYYYEKAELARQQQDWHKIASLGDQALNAGHKLDNTWELIPFIEGYARSGRLEDARAVSFDAIQAKPEGKLVTHSILCATWARLGQDQAAGTDLSSFANQLQTEIGCRQ